MSCIDVLQKAARICCCWFLKILFASKLSLVAVCTGVANLLVVSWESNYCGLLRWLNLTGCLCMETCVTSKLPCLFLYYREWSWSQAGLWYVNCYFTGYKYVSVCTYFEITIWQNFTTADAINCLNTAGYQRHTADAVQCLDTAGYQRHTTDAVRCLNTAGYQRHTADAVRCLDTAGYQRHTVTAQIKISNKKLLMKLMT
jgi:hypothetical protein